MDSVESKWKRVLHSDLEAGAGWNTFKIDCTARLFCLTFGEGKKDKSLKITLPGHRRACTHDGHDLEVFQIQMCGSHELTSDELLDLQERSKSVKFPEYTGTLKKKGDPNAFAAVFADDYKHRVITLQSNQLMWSISSDDPPLNSLMLERAVIEWDEDEYPPRTLYIQPHEDNNPTGRVYDFRASSTVEACAWFKVIHASINMMDKNYDLDKYLDYRWVEKQVPCGAMQWVSTCDSAKGGNDWVGNTRECRSSAKPSCSASNLADDKVFTFWSPLSIRNEWILFDFKIPFAVSGFKYRTREGKGCPRDCFLQCSDVRDDKFCNVVHWKSNLKAGWECVNVRRNLGPVPYPIARYWRLLIVSTYGEPAEVIEAGFKMNRYCSEEPPIGFQQLKYRILDCDVPGGAQSAKAIMHDSGEFLAADGTSLDAVSYTHLTLPTKRIV
eukprot:TRINITY_DN18063_c0_g2_i3.p1 TRINITY_DN18063_c0_g2~~TRINITY_DN18063_c0_g2_i3.p1  ORF type:complete len:441 (-),score=85.64 TRINITY_DN18063_c0_g2_i3:76-1398(-)